jgi:hypothetical protein
MDIGIHKLAAVVLLAATIASPVTALAVAYYPLYHLQAGDETAAAVGQTIYLFYSGTDEERRSLHEGDILAVSRIDRSCAAAVIGKIQVLGLLGETYLKAEVVEGRIKVGDIARKDAIACLVIPAEPCQR